MGWMILLKYKNATARVGKHVVFLWRNPIRFRYGFEIMKWHKPRCISHLRKRQEVSIGKCMQNTRPSYLFVRLIQTLVITDPYVYDGCGFLSLFIIP